VPLARDQTNARRLCRRAGRGGEGLGNAQGNLLASGGKAPCRKQVDSASIPRSRPSCLGSPQCSNTQAGQTLITLSKFVTAMWQWRNSDYPYR
jgi:hypothetical protein